MDQNKEIVCVEKFVNDLRDSKVSNESLSSKFLLFTQIDIKFEQDRDIMLYEIYDELRELLADNAFEVYSRSNNPELFTTVISEQDSSSQLVLMAGGKAITYFLVENNRIKALSTLSKGGSMVFLKW